jgi:nucleoside phosphorylase
VASKHTRIPRAINEFKTFLSYYHEEYRDALKHIRPSEGWNIEYYRNEIFQLPLEMHGNLYEGIYPRLLPENPVADEEIINSFKGCLAHFIDLNSVFDKILDSRKKNKEEVALWSVEGILNELLSKAIFKLKEVIRLAEEDLLRYEHGEDDKGNDNELSYTIGIVTATIDEFKAIRKLITHESMLPTKREDSQIYYEGYFERGSKKIKVILTQCHHQGTAAASNVTTKFVLRFKPNILAMIGHAAGNKNLIGSLNIGDILICSQAVDYDQVSIIEKKGSDGKPQIRRKDRKMPIESDATIIRLLTDYCEKEGNLARIKDEYDNKELFESPLSYKTGLLISGDALVRSENWFQKTVSDNAGAIGLDMETYGVYYSGEYTLFKDKPIYISIKSVSDFGSHRSDFDEAIKDHTIRVKYATYTSAKLFYEFALTYLPI